MASMTAATILGIELRILFKYSELRESHDSVTAFSYLPLLSLPSVVAAQCQGRGHEAFSSVLTKHFQLD